MAVSPLNIPQWRAFPLRRPPRRALRAAGAGRQRRQGAGTGRGLARRGAWLRRLRRDGRVDRCRWRDRGRRAAARRRLVERRATSATSSWSPTVGRVAAAPAAVSRPRRRARASPRSPGGPRPRPRRRSWPAPGGWWDAAVGWFVVALDLRLACVAGSVALGFGEPFFAAANAELEAVARIGYAAGRPHRPRRPRRRGAARSAPRRSPGGVRRSVRTVTPEPDLHPAVDRGWVLDAGRAVLAPPVAVGDGRRGRWRTWPRPAGGGTGRGSPCPTPRTSASASRPPTAIPPASPNRTTS